MPHIKAVFSALILYLFSTTAFAQYTETINSNRPGQSQGAFSVGTGVYQLEVGAFYSKESHDLLFTDTKGWGTDFELRAGVWREQLEINFSGSYLYQKITPTSGSGDALDFSGFPVITLGAKYLVYDPYKFEKEEVNLYSYWANRGFKWKMIIPAVSIYAGANYIYSDNPFAPASQEGFSPKFTAITQNNWGALVWVNNIIADQVLLTDFPTYAWISTLTHTFTPKIAGFVEYQMIKSDIYADDIVRAGAAYLLTKDIQIDINGLADFKDTPQRYQLGMGISYRFDRHTVDEEIPSDLESK